MSRRAPVLSALLLSSLLTVPALAAEPGDTVVPGIGMGPLKLGMTEAEVGAVMGAEPVTQGWASHVRRVGPWEFDVDNGKVVRIASTPDHKRPLLIGVTALDLSHIERAAEGIGGCGPVQHNRGGDLIVCAQGVRLGMAPHGDAVTVSVVPPGAPLPGGPVDVSSAIRATTVPGANHGAMGRVGPPQPVYALRPGDGLGPIRLGMSEAEVRALEAEHPIRAGYAPSILNVGHFEVQLKDGKVVRASVMPATLGALVKFQPSGLNLPRVGLEAVAEVIGGCGPVEHLEGGNRIVCGGGVTIYQPGLTRNLRFDVGVATTEASPKAGAPTCDAYAHLGDPSHKIAVGPGQYICVDSRMVPQSSQAGDIVGTLGFNTCDKVAATATTPASVTCAFDGVRFIFNGANGTLGTVEGVAVRTP